MAMLTGDVEAEWTSGAINREDALRLWNRMPSTARMIVEYGPDLINVFVSGRDMMSRVNAAVDVRSDWQERLGNWWSAIEMGHLILSSATSLNRLNTHLDQLGLTTHFS